MNYKIAVGNVRVPSGKSFLEWLFGGAECRAVLVWEYEGNRVPKKSTWQVILDPGYSEMEAKKEAEKAAKICEHVEMRSEFAECLHDVEPSISLPPKEPE